MFHDPDVYDNPEDFWPDRFIQSKYGTKKGKEDDLGRRNTYHFGSGRVSACTYPSSEFVDNVENQQRMCAGMNLAGYSSVSKIFPAVIFY